MLTLVFVPDWWGTCPPRSNESWRPQRHASAKWHEPMEVFRPIWKRPLLISKWHHPVAVRTHLCHPSERKKIGMNCCCKNECTFRAVESGTVLISHSICCNAMVTWFLWPVLTMLTDSSIFYTAWLFALLGFLHSLALCTPYFLAIVGFWRSFHFSRSLIFYTPSVFCTPYFLNTLLLFEFFCGQRWDGV